MYFIYIGVKKTEAELFYCVKFTYEQQLQVISSDLLKRQWPVKLKLFLESSMFWYKTKGADEVEVHAKPEILEIESYPIQIACKYYQIY